MKDCIYLYLAEQEYWHEQKDEFLTHNIETSNRHIC